MFPTTLDTLPDPTSPATTSLGVNDHSGMHTTENEHIEAIEAKVGVDGSAVATSHDYKLAQLLSTVLTVQTTDATLTALGAGVSVATNKAAAFLLSVVGKVDGASADFAAWEVRGGVVNNAGTLTVVVSSTMPLANVSGWDDPVVDASGTTIRIRIKGEAGKTVNWRCVARLTNDT